MEFLQAKSIQIQKAVNTRALRELENYRILYQRGKSSSRTLYNRFFQSSRLVMSCGIALFCFLIREALSIGGFLDGFYPLQWIAFVGFGIWATFDVLDLKLLNRPIVTDEESKWGFGQVYAMLVIASLGFALLDARQGKPGVSYTTEDC